MTPFRTALALLLTLAATSLLAPAPLFAQAPPGGAARGPAKVGTMVLEQADVPRRLVLPGRAIASQEARIRPRVTGMVTEILYTPGQRLEAGAPMFRLDDSTLQAEVESARDEHADRGGAGHGATTRSLLWFGRDASGHTLSGEGGRSYTTAWRAAG